MLRACGVNYDIRKVDGYGFYPRFKFRIPLGNHGDTYDRLMMRALEMRESISILKQAFEQIPAGPVMNPKVKIRAFRPPVGEAYGRIEAPKGELGFYLISDGSPNPYRYRVRPPSFINLTILEDLCLGHTVADVMVILGSVDIVMGKWIGDEEVKKLQGLHSYKVALTFILSHRRGDSPYACTTLQLL